MLDRIQGPVTAHGETVNPKSLLIAASNRSDFGLLRAFILRLGQAEGTEHIGAVTLLLFSDAVDSCREDADRDYAGTRIVVRTLENSRQREAESLGDHFARLSVLFDADVLTGYDVVLIAGDRYECLALALRSFFHHLPILHFFGGDISHGGHFDDHLRHAISHLAAVHFPVNEAAKQNLINCQQDPSRIFQLGSPVVDVIAAVARDEATRGLWNVVLSFNPMTLGAPTEVAESLKASLEALDCLAGPRGLRCIATRPNNEPGADTINALLDEYAHRSWLEVVQSLGSPAFLYALKSADLIVGNSSSQLLEAPVLGTRSLLVGDRQKGRHRPTGVAWLPGVPGTADVLAALTSMLDRPRPEPCSDYGREGVSETMVTVVDRLLALPLPRLLAKSVGL